MTVIRVRSLLALILVAGCVGGCVGLSCYVMTTSIGYYIVSDLNLITSANLTAASSANYKTCGKVVMSFDQGGSTHYVASYQASTLNTTDSCQDTNGKGLYAIQSAGPLTWSLLGFPNATNYKNITNYCCTTDNCNGVGSWAGLQPRAPVLLSSLAALAALLLLAVTV